MLLQSYFGQKHKIIEACTRPIVKGPVLYEHDHRGLIKFSAEFTSCLITLEGMECLDRMDNMEMVTKIMHRLPPSWIPGWQYEVDQIMHVMHRDISIKDFGDFVRRKTKEITNLSQISTSSRPPNSQEKNATRKATTFSTQMKNHKASSAPKCPMCTHEHYLNQCKEFRALSYHGRLKFVNQQKLCRACLNGGHFARSCNWKNEACKKEGCKQFHTTLLHPPDEDKLDAATKPTRENETKQKVTNGYINLPQRERSLLPIVPVKIRVRGYVRYVVTQALLDTGSTHSFITEGLRKALKIEDYEEVGISTITFNENQGQQMTKIVKNLEISDMDEFHSYPAEFPLFLQAATSEPSGYSNTNRC